MEISREQVGPIATLTLAGRLTVTDTPGRLKNEAADAIRAGATAVILDLTHVPYIDSTRLGELIATQITVSRQNGRLALVCPTQRITALLKLAGLEGVFETFPSVDAARTALGG